MSRESVGVPLTVREAGRVPIFVLTIAILVLAPLPFGSNRPWSWSALALLTGGLLIAATVSAMLGRDRFRGSETGDHARLVGIFWLVTGVLAAWVALGTLSWLPSDWHHPAWARAGAALGRALPGAVALSPDRAWDTLMRIISYVGIFWLALRTGALAARGRQLMWALALAGAAYAGYGVIVELGGFDRILWYPKWTYTGRLTSTFVNANAFATYAGLGLVCALALLLDQLYASVSGTGRRLQSRTAVLDQLGFSAWALITTMVVLATALLLTGSRAGLAATAAAVVVLIVCFRQKGRVWRQAWIAVVLAIGLTGAALLTLSGDIIARRVETQSNLLVGRQGIFTLTTEQISDHTIMGVGLGGFAGTFHAARDERFGANVKTVHRVHNSYLEIALEAGLPMALLILSGFAIVLWRCGVGVVRRRRGIVFPATGLAASVVVGLHALLDFSIQIPAVAVMYAALMGVALAQSQPSGATNGPSTSSATGRRVDPAQHRLGSA